MTSRPRDPVGEIGVRRPSAPVEIPPDPVIEAFMADVDRTLLRENLALTIAERMERFFAFLRSLEGIRGTAAPRDRR